MNDTCDEEIVEKLKEYGVKHIALRCAGFNNVDLYAAERLGISVVRVPAYSPYAVAEHAVALMMALDRKVRARSRARLSQRARAEGREPDGRVRARARRALGARRSTARTCARARATTSSRASWATRCTAGRSESSVPARLVNSSRRA